MNKLETIIIEVGKETLRVSGMEDNVNPKQLCDGLGDYIIFCSGYDEVEFCRHHCKYSKSREKTDREYF